MKVFFFSFFLYLPSFFSLSASGSKRSHSEADRQQVRKELGGGEAQMITAGRDPNKNPQVWDRDGS